MELMAEPCGTPENRKSGEGNFPNKLTKAEVDDL
jgi:hypothetical protein